MAKNRILKDGVYKLLEAQKIGSRLSRQEIKKQGLEDRTISSVRSFEVHKNNWEEFADWVFNKHKVRQLGKITQDMLKEFIQERAETGGRDGKGATKKTLQAYISGVNKVMISSGRWEGSDKPTLTKWGNEIQVGAHKGNAQAFIEVSRNLGHNRLDVLLKYL